MTAARTLKAVFDKLIDVYQSDSALTTWCNTNFGEQPEIQAGIDEDDLPDLEGKKLAIRIIPGARSRSRTMSKRSHGLIIRGIIKNTSKREPVVPDPDDPPADPPVIPETGWLTLEALELVDQFISLIEEATIPAIQGEGIAITSFEGAPDQIIYPYARAELAYLIEIPSKLS